MRKLYFQDARIESEIDTAKKATIAPLIQTRDVDLSDPNAFETQVPPITFEKRETGIKQRSQAYVTRLVNAVAPNALNPNEQFTVASNAPIDVHPIAVALHRESSEYRKSFWGSGENAQLTPDEQQEAYVNAWVICLEEYTKESHGKGQTDVSFLEKMGIETTKGRLALEISFARYTTEVFSSENPIETFLKKVADATDKRKLSQIEKDQMGLLAQAFHPEAAADIVAIADRINGGDDTLGEKDNKVTDPLEIARLTRLRGFLENSVNNRVIGNAHDEIETSAKPDQGSTLGDGVGAEIAEPFGANGDVQSEANRKPGKSEKNEGLAVKNQKHPDIIIPSDLSTNHNGYRGENLARREIPGKGEFLTFGDESHGAASFHNRNDLHPKQQDRVRYIPESAGFFAVIADGNGSNGEIVASDVVENAPTHYNGLITQGENFQQAYFETTQWLASRAKEGLGGSVAVMAKRVGDVIHIGMVGDCQAWTYGPGKAEEVSGPPHHSPDHEDNVITRNIGPGSRTDPNYKEVKLNDPLYAGVDHLVLNSDGADQKKYFQPGEVYRIIEMMRKEGKSYAEISSKLVDIAVQRGSTDNVSIMVIPL